MLGLCCPREEVTSRQPGGPEEPSARLALASLPAPYLFAAEMSCCTLNLRTLLASAAHAKQVSMLHLSVKGCAHVNLLWIGVNIKVGRCSAAAITPSTRSLDWRPMAQHGAKHDQRHPPAHSQRPWQHLCVGNPSSIRSMWHHGTPSETRQ